MQPQVAPESSVFYRFRSNQNPQPQDGSQPQVGAATSQPQVGAGAQQASQPWFLWNNLPKKPLILSPHDGPLQGSSQPQGPAISQPQVGPQGAAISQPQVGAGAQQASQASCLWNNLPSSPPLCPQPLSQQGSTTSQPQVGPHGEPHGAATSQPQAGSTSQQASQALLPQSLSNNPNAEASVEQIVKRAAAMAGTKMRRII